MISSVLKNIRFNMDDEDDKALYDWLATLPRGKFSEGTKEYWIKKMNESKLKERDVK